MNRQAEIREHVEALSQLLDARRATALANLVREPRPLERIVDFIRAGWVTEEVEFLDAEMNRDEVIVTFDSWEVVTDRRTIDRADLRVRYRPRNFTRLDAWESRFPKIPDRPKVNSLE